MSRPLPAISRRRLLASLGGGFAGLALTDLLARDGVLLRRDGGVHHRPRVSRVIQLFMNGGASPVDTFDDKPRLRREHGRRFDPGGGQLVESVTGSPGFKVLQSPFTFTRCGESGRAVSSVFPHLASVVDRLAFLMSVTTPSNVHGIASYAMNTGFGIPGFPCAGAWISYALGSLVRDLPDFVVLPDARGLPYNNQGNFSAGFLPSRHQGTIIRPDRDPPIPYLAPPEGAQGITLESERAGRALLRTLGERHAERHPGESRLEARIESYELAALMQLSAPELFDISRETPATRELYGIDEEPTREFGLRCLLARRMVERGVRFVQVWSGAGGPTKNWDNHGHIETELPYMAQQVDRPMTALILDLASRGLLDDTLVVWTTEFGRMPFSQGQAGRDHNGGTFVTWFAGGGIAEGASYGQSDDWGWKAEIPISVHDVHATILWLLGIDHTRLTVRHHGIDRRLTDVSGEVIREILA